MSIDIFRMGRKIRFLILFLLSSLFLFSKPKADSLICLKVKCEVINQEIPVQNAEIWIYNRNEVIAKVFTDSAGSIEFTFRRNSQYSLLIKEDGFHKKIISISTFLPVDDNDFETVFNVECSLEMRPEILYNKDHDALDFPYALLSFYPKKENFLFAEEYTKQIKKELNELEELVALDNERNSNKRHSNFESPDAKKIQALIDGK